MSMLMRRCGSFRLLVGVGRRWGVCAQVCGEGVEEVIDVAEEGVSGDVQAVRDRCSTNVDHAVSVHSRHGSRDTSGY